jgi:flagellar basal-body rod protein FlgC
MSLFGTLSVSASALSAQRLRAAVVAENMANSETTRTPEGGPYRRKQVIFESQAQGSPFASELERASSQSLASQIQGVMVREVVNDPREAQLRYQPGHPDANAEGYVAFPQVEPAEEMADLMSASRGYQSNVSAMVAVRDMINRSLDLLR